MSLICIIWSGDFDNQNEKLHDQEMTYAVIEQFLRLYGMWHMRHEKLNYQNAIASIINLYYLTSCNFEDEWSDGVPPTTSTVNNVIKTKMSFNTEALSLKYQQHIVCFALIYCLIYFSRLTFHNTKGSSNISLDTLNNMYIVNTRK